MRTPSGLFPLTSIGVLLLVIIAVFSGLWSATSLGRNSLNMDEIMQAEVARGAKSYEPPTTLFDFRSWPKIVDGAALQHQPPLAYFLQRLPNQFSATDSAQRAVACTSGMVAVFCTGLLGALVGGIRVGALSALLISFSPLHIDLSRFARPYTLSEVFWLITILVAYWAYLRDTRRAWIVLAVTSFLFLNTRTDLPLFALAAIGAVFVLARCWRGVTALLAAGLAYLPVFVPILNVGSERLGKPLPGNWFNLLRAMVALADPLPLILLPLALLGAWAIRSVPLARLAIGLSSLTLFFHFAFWSARIEVPLNPRYIDYCSIPFAILGAFGFWSLTAPLSRFRNAQSMVLVILVAVLALLGLRIGQIPTKEGWREAALLASRFGIDHIWIFKTGEDRQDTGQPPMWAPDFYGNWYVPIAYSNPLSPGVSAPKGKLAILVWRQRSLDTGLEPVLGTMTNRFLDRMLGVRSRLDSGLEHLPEVDAFEHFRLDGMHLYVPRRTCSSRCALDSTLTILSDQPGYAGFRREALALTRNASFE